MKKQQDSCGLPRPGATEGAGASTVGPRRSWRDPTVDAARVTPNAALREEGEALARAYETAKTSGAASVEAVRALRSAQVAHARFYAASGQMRTLSGHADRVHPAAEAPAPPPGAKAA